MEFSKLTFSFKELTYLAAAAVAYFAQATEKGFNLFTTTLVNGKLGHASENALAFAFSVLGVDWTESEKSSINQILESHNFVTRI